MNYPNYYPNPYFQPQYQPQLQQGQQMQMQQTQQPTQQQIQNGGYVTVRSEEEARNYPLAPGNSMTFFDETKSYCYKKTMGFSPLDQPTFKKYRIIEEEVVDTLQTTQDSHNEVKQDIDTLKEEIESLKAEIETLKNKVKNLSARTNNSSKGGKHYESQSE